ncbi:MAG: DUF1428 family protein [Thermoproteota archaeon]|jgi:hypothetical protein|nr:DUF1428 family protein [Thermoproteota archaeon]
MSKSSEVEIKNEKEIGSIVQQFLYRLPKKNHQAMLQLERKFIDAFRRNGGLRYEVFQLNGTENMMEWTNIAKTMSANQDEEIWVEQVHYRDCRERDEFMAICGKDENMTRLYKQCMDLITPGSTIMGELKRVEV